MPGHSLDGGGVEEIGIVFERARQQPAGIEDLQNEIELALALGLGPRVQRQGLMGRFEVGGVQVEHHVEER